MKTLQEHITWIVDKCLTFCRPPKSDNQIIKDNETKKYTNDQLNDSWKRSILKWRRKTDKESAVLTKLGSLYHMFETVIEKRDRQETITR